MSGVVDEDTVYRAGSLAGRQPSPHQTAMLGDLRPHRAPDVESPVMETLGPGREVVAVIGQYSLLESGILAGGLG